MIAYYDNYDYDEKFFVDKFHSVHIFYHMLLYYYTSFIKIFIHKIMLVT